MCISIFAIYGPLSDITSPGLRAMMTCLLVVWGSFAISIHRRYSLWSKWKRSTPRFAHDLSGMLWHRSGSFTFLFLKVLQIVHFNTTSSICLDMPGQNNTSLALSLHLTVPRWASLEFLKTSPSQQLSSSLNVQYFFKLLWPPWLNCFHRQLQFTILCCCSFELTQFLSWDWKINL